MNVPKDILTQAQRQYRTSGIVCSPTNVYRKVAEGAKFRKEVIFSVVIGKRL